MKNTASFVASLDPDRFWNGSRVLLGSGFALTLLLLLWLTWQASVALWVIPILCAGVLVLIRLAQDELLLLCAILAGFVVAAGYKEGFQLEEVLYGLCYLSYLAYWFISRFCFYRDRILQTKIDWALFLFLLYVTGSFGITVLLEGDLSAMLSEWLSISMLAFYFPIKETIARDRRAARALILVAGWIALFVVVRNVSEYVQGLSSAVYLWQIATGRVVMNEHVLMLCGIGALVFLLHCRAWHHRVLLLGLYLAYSVGVVIGQSRAVWVSFLLGTFVIFVLIDRPRKRQMIVLGAVGLALLIAVALFFFPQYVSLVLAGLLDRFFSLTTATSADISLINRFIEMRAAWEQIKQNPVVGHGFGVTYRYYSLVYEATHVSSFVHNGYVGVLYRHGLIGFGLLYYYYFASVWQSFRLYRSARTETIYALIGLAVAAGLVAEALIANTENPFANADKTLMIGLLGGLTAGSWKRLRNDASDAVPLASA